MVQAAATAWQVAERSVRCWAAAKAEVQTRIWPWARSVGARSAGQSVTAFSGSYNSGRRVYRFGAGKPEEPDEAVQGLPLLPPVMVGLLHAGFALIPYFLALILDGGDVSHPSALEQPRQKSESVIGQRQKPSWASCNSNRRDSNYTQTCGSAARLCCAVIRPGWSLSALHWHSSALGLPIWRLYMPSSPGCLGRTRRTLHPASRLTLAALPESRAAIRGQPVRSVCKSS